MVHNMAVEEFKMDRLLRQILVSWNTELQIGFNNNYKRKVVSSSVQETQNQKYPVIVLSIILN